MKATRAMLTCALLVAGCSQMSDHFYSKGNFTAQSFDADISQCKRQNPSFVAMQSYAAADRRQLDDAMVRDCMKAKGYTIQTESK
jgi:hypothetical protein